MLIDEFLPHYQIRKEHEIIVNSSENEVYQAVLSLDMSRSVWIKALFRFRGLPESALTLIGLQNAGFTMLGQNPGQELLLGLAGQFWTPAGELQKLTPAAFKSFDRKGYAKAAWNFSLEPVHPDKTKVKTETRIYCSGRKSYRKFRIYWLMIRPFSSWIRKESLKIIKRESENRFSAETKRQHFCSLNTINLII